MNSQTSVARPRRPFSFVPQPPTRPERRDNGLYFRTDWQTLTRFEPKLIALERLALSYRRRDLQTRLAVYASLKRRLEDLVGQNCQRATIGLDRHWESAVRHLASVLGV